MSDSQVGWDRRWYPDRSGVGPWVIFKLGGTGRETLHSDHFIGETSSPSIDMTSACVAM